MAQKALGIIETFGTIPSIEAADAAFKAADVTFVKKWMPGSGLVCLSFEGDVASVKAALDAACESASRVGRVVSTSVIARPQLATDTL